MSMVANAPKLVSDHWRLIDPAQVRRREDMSKDG